MHFPADLVLTIGLNLLHVGKTAPQPWASSGPTTLRHFGGLYTWSPAFAQRIPHLATGRHPGWPSAREKRESPPTVLAHPSFDTRGANLCSSGVVVADDALWQIVCKHKSVTPLECVMVSRPKRLSEHRHQQQLIDVRPTDDKFCWLARRNRKGRLPDHTMRRCADKSKRSATWQKRVGPSGTAQHVPHKATSVTGQVLRRCTTK